MAPSAGNSGSDFFGGSYLQEESRVLLTLGRLPASVPFRRKSSRPWKGILEDWADLQGRIMWISMPVLLSGADREVCVCSGLETPATHNISSGGSINKSDHNAKGRRGGQAQTLGRGSQDPHHQVPRVHVQGQGKQVGGVPMNQGKCQGGITTGEREKDFLLGLGHGPAVLMICLGFLF